MTSDEYTWTKMYKQGPPPPGFVPPPPYNNDGAPQHLHHVPPNVAPSVVIIHPTQFGPDPQTLTCPYCQSTITTNVEASPSVKTHLFALLVCLFFCWPCAPCVYCVDSCLVKKHYCPSCRKFLGMYDN